MEPGTKTAAGDAVRHARLRAHYDALGAGQDAEAWYEDPALDDLCDRGRFAEARAVFEFGTGTGRFAERLLASHLPDDATYIGTDLSPVMVGLAQARLVRFGSRCQITQAGGAIEIPLDDRSVDRVVAAFVL
ncbi:MAG: class I SAM-dependent methyltransferase, partial [Hyphomicrobiales bacterium]